MAALLNGITYALFAGGVTSEDPGKWPWVIVLVVVSAVVCGVGFWMGRSTMNRIFHR
ncbi:MAG: hypothetical protein L0H79_14270 [Intrasporangium sp.]|uniref:hypothetical protein n=1 Tax=Intrasporangium sp. TaxID=1925024 RepID=UPI0026497F36|nr:hypothetical protein [Intrasporangium sp.]MDN5796906.1 hypothetical protein [Intrasporangium sp.]